MELNNATQKFSNRILAFKFTHKWSFQVRFVRSTQIYTDVTRYSDTSAEPINFQRLLARILMSVACYDQILKSPCVWQKSSVIPAKCCDWALRNTKHISFLFGTISKHDTISKSSHKCQHLNNDYNNEDGVANHIFWKGNFRYLQESVILWAYRVKGQHQHKMSP